MLSCTFAEQYWVCSCDGCLTIGSTMMKYYTRQLNFNVNQYSLPSMSLVDTISEECSGFDTMQVYVPLSFTSNLSMTNSLLTFSCFTLPSFFQTYEHLCISSSVHSTTSSTLSSSLTIRTCTAFNGLRTSFNSYVYIHV